MELYPNDIGACPSHNLANFVTGLVCLREVSDKNPPISSILAGCYY